MLFGWLIPSLDTDTSSPRVSGRALGGHLIGLCVTSLYMRPHELWKVTTRERSETRREATVRAYIAAAISSRSGTTFVHRLEKNSGAATQVG